MSELTKWTKEDIAAHRVLEELLSKKVSWNVSTAESIQLYKSLVWFSQLARKIEDSQAEVVSIKQMEPRQPGKKATRDAKAAAAQVGT